MIRIGIIIDDITAKAGTERAVSSLVNGLLKFYPEQYEITVISIFSDKTKQPFFELNPNITVVHLEKKSNFTLWNKAFWYKHFVKSIREVNKKAGFDILTGTTYVHNILLPYIVKNTHTKTIGCEHVVYKYPSGFIRIIRKLAYPKLTLVVVLNQKEKQQFSFLSNVVVIPNSLPFEIQERASLESRKIISAGRLTYEKGFDLLIDIFEEIHKEKPDWELDVFGAGEDFDMLNQKIKEKKLESSIRLRGSVKNISENYVRSSIFALTSRTESFGLAVLEAMNHGLPVVAFDCEGPNSLLSEGKTGFLITRFDKQQFVEKLLLLIEETDRRKKMGEEAFIASLEYEEKNIIPLWNSQIQLITQYR